MGNLIGKQLEVILSDDSSYKFPVLFGHSWSNVQWGANQKNESHQNTQTWSLQNGGSNILTIKDNGVLNNNAFNTLASGTKVLTLKNGSYMTYQSSYLYLYDRYDNFVCWINVGGTVYSQDFYSCIALYDETEEKYRLGYCWFTVSSDTSVSLNLTYYQMNISDKFNDWLEGAIAPDDIIGTGGGATHIAKVTGQLSALENNLSDVLIVAGGGGGGLISNETPTTGANGGGISGSGSNSADQTTGYAFGQGESSGGGSGLYGGYKAANGNSGGAGSGYIGNALLSNKKMVGYNVPTSSAESTKTESVQVYSANAEANKPKAGNGFVRITWLRELE